MSSSAHRAELLRGQIAFASSRGSDAPPLLLKAARQFEPLDPRLARETYLDALSAAIFAGRLALVAGCGRRPRPRAPRRRRRGLARAPDLLLDGLAPLTTEGYPAGAPVLQQAVSAFRGTEVSREEGLRWLWLACRAAELVWDYGSWDVLSDRHVTLARDAGALITMPIAFNMRALAHLFAGEFTAAASMVTQVESVTEATGSSIAPYAALVLAALRGRETEAAHRSRPPPTTRSAAVRVKRLASAQWANAVLYNSLGRYEEALAAAQRASEDSPAVQLRQLGARRARRGGGAQRGTRARGRRLQRLSGITRASGTDWALGAEARSRALVSDGEAAESLYREAIDHLGRTRLRWDLAVPTCSTVSGCAASGACVTPGISCAARTRSSNSVGIEAFAERARAELRATGAQALNAPPGHPTC